MVVGEGPRALPINIDMKQVKNMNFEIRRLEPDMAEDYVDFFDRTPHDDNVDEHKCYCVCWCSADHRSVDDELSSAENRRKLAKQYVENGIIQGYTAYCGDKMVGWCNTNSKNERINCSSWLRFMHEVESSENEKVKSVFCFLVSPDMRGKGIAKMMLDKICHDAEKDGFDYIEAYPRDNSVSSKNNFSNFQGPYKIYEQAGFVRYKKLTDKVVMRKYLK